MLQWIPRTQTLEPKIWGQVGPRQGLYIGLGVFGAIFFLVALAPFGIGPRIAAALLALVAGAVAGFIRIKGLSPERYLIHRLRFAMRRNGFAVLQIPYAPARSVEVELSTRTKRNEDSPRGTAASARKQSRRATAAKVAPEAKWGECTAGITPFGLGFQLAALGTMGATAAWVVGSSLG